MPAAMAQCRLIVRLY